MVRCEEIENYDFVNWAIDYNLLMIDFKWIWLFPLTKKFLPM